LKDLQAKPALNANAAATISDLQSAVEKARSRSSDDDDDDDSKQ